MNPNQQFIDGSWYDIEYGSKWYKSQYIDSDYPEWAKEADTYGVRFMAMCSGISLFAKVLDCGSGVGRIMQTWRKNGFKDIWGIEISRVAWLTAKGDYKPNNVIHGSVQNMSMFQDNEFDLLTSFALLEHIDESILADVLNEMSRVSRKQAHFIAHEAGTDPSHINIKSFQEWFKVFDKHIDAKEKVTFCIQNPLIDCSPLFLIMPRDELTEPIKHSLKQMKNA